ncbi:MAG: hypothetical protein ABEH90_08115 [Halolamina sp.]
MDVSRASVWAAVVVVVGVTLASGPLIGAVQFTAASEADAPPGSGHARATVLSTPDSATLEKGEYGSGSYYLRIPDAVVRLADVSGQPLLSYQLYIRELGYSRATTHFLSPSNEGRMEVSLSSDAFAPEEIKEERYRGELILRLRDDGGERTLVEKNVTVAVRG